MMMNEWKKDKIDKKNNKIVSETLLWLYSIKNEGSNWIQMHNFYIFDGPRINNSIKVPKSANRLFPNEK